MQRQEKAGGSSASKILRAPAGFSVVTLFLLALACEEAGRPVSSPTEVELAARLKASCGLSESGDPEELESEAGVSSAISRQICDGFDGGEEKAALNQYANILKKLIDGQPLGGPELDQLNGLLQLTLEDFDGSDSEAEQLIEDLVLVTTGESFELGGDLEDTDTFLIPPIGGTFTHDNGLLALVFGAWGNTATVVCTKLADDSAPLNYDEDRQFPQFVDCVMIPNIAPISPPYSMTSCIKEDVVPDDIEDLLALAKNEGEGIVIGDPGGTPGPVPNCPAYGAEGEVILSRHGGETGVADGGKRDAPGGLDLAGKTGVGQFSAMTPFGFVDTTTTTTATIGGFVLIGEDSVSNATVNLFCDGVGTPATATTTSNSDGFYFFDNAEDSFDVGDSCFLTAQTTGLFGREPPVNEDPDTFTVESGANVRDIHVNVIVG